MAAAASNKPTAVHFSLIFFVMLSIILGVATYQYHALATDEQEKSLKEGKEKTAVTKSWQDARDEISKLSELIGIQGGNAYNQANPSDPATVFGGAKERIVKAAKSNAKATLLDTVDALSRQLETVTADRDGQEAIKATFEKQLADLKNKQQNELTGFRNAKSEAEKSLREALAGVNEKIAIKDKSIAQLQASLRNTQNDLDKEREAREDERKKLSQQLKDRDAKLVLLRNRLNELEQTNFEVADGDVRKVDSQNRLVWISLGSADALQEQMTFSVYARESDKLGRGPENIKGKIQVTKIVENHLAEARILEESPLNPIVPLDVIHTPAWSPGRREHFAFVGYVDLDLNGGPFDLARFKENLKRFKEVVAVRGGSVDLEINAEGDRVITPPNGEPRKAEEGEVVNEGHKFLVIGELPNLLDKSNAAEEEIFKKFHKEAKLMEEEARARGVQVVNLNRFLGYIGYVPRAHLFKPNSDMKLPTAKAREAAGTVSESVSSRRKALAPKQSYGTTTSKATQK